VGGDELLEGAALAVAAGQKVNQLEAAKRAAKATAAASGGAGVAAGPPEAAGPCADASGHEVADADFERVVLDKTRDVSLQRSAPTPTVGEGLSGERGAQWGARGCGLSCV
jgi:hypothetical protein